MLTATDSRRKNPDTLKWIEICDGDSYRNKCDNIYIGGGKCVCWKCGKETPLKQETHEPTEFAIILF